jgi:phasin family protein
MDTTFNPTTDFSMMLAQLKLPGFDMPSLVEAQRKNIDAVTQANQRAYEGMQALVQKQQEIFSKRVEEIQATVQKMSGSNPQEAITEQLAFVQRMMTKTFEDMRELAETAQKSQAEVLGGIGKRAG